MDHPGTRDKVIFATWTGVFRYHPGMIPRWVLQIHQMSDFRFICDHCPELHKDDPIHLALNRPCRIGLRTLEPLRIDAVQQLNTRPVCHT